MEDSIQLPRGCKKTCAPRCRRFRKPVEAAAEPDAEPSAEANKCITNSDEELSQTWLNRRLTGLHKDLVRIGIYTTSALSPPPGFEKSWMRCTDMQKLDTAELSETEREVVKHVQSIVIISNPFDLDELTLLMQVIHTIDRTFGHHAPPMFWIPHTVAPEVRPPHMNLTMRHQFIKDVLDCGIDGIIAGEPEGARLRRAIKARVLHSQHLSNQLTNMMADRFDKLQFRNYLQECIQSMFWDYARARIADNIPTVDTNIAPGVPKELSGFAVGEQLGKGSSGTVYKLHPNSSKFRVGEELLRGLVVKAVDKNTVREVTDLRNIKRTIEVMRHVSSEKHKHANVVEFFGVFHSPTHLLFVMEAGGDENLYRRLVCRSHPEPEKRRPLSLPMVESLIAQAVVAVQHIHMACSLSHRDLKPENFVLRESEDDIILKLTDFDSAVMHQPGMWCRSMCGTMPFTAPEVMLERKYDGQKYDIWSFAILLLEVLCGVRIIERALTIQMEKAKGRQQAFTTQDKFLLMKIKEYFTEPGAAERLLQHFHVYEVQPICSLMSTVLNGMLNVDASQRWDANQVAEHLTVPASDSP